MPFLMFLLTLERPRKTSLKISHKNTDRKRPAKTESSSRSQFVTTFSRQASGFPSSDCKTVDSSLDFGAGDPFGFS